MGLRRRRVGGGQQSPSSACTGGTEHSHLGLAMALSTPRPQHHFHIIYHGASFLMMHAHRLLDHSSDQQRSISSITQPSHQDTARSRRCSHPRDANQPPLHSPPAQQGQPHPCSEQHLQPNPTARAHCSTLRCCREMLCATCFGQAALRLYFQH